MKQLLRKTVGIMLAAAMCTGLVAQNVPTKRGELFDTGNYAMFIHWGLYANLGDLWKGKTYYGISEWIMHRDRANINIDEYKAISREFNPVEFDAMKIAQLAKDAGMKYIIITSKHHDGFAMYHSACNKFNIVDATPFKRDPMKELSDACHQLGLGFGFYYSHFQDWTYPGGGGGPAVDKDGNPKTFDDYFYEKCLPQVEEITKNYGDIELIWFDTPGSIPQKYVEKLVEVVHENQPKALVSGRAGYGLGDYTTFGDMEIPLTNIDGLWETVDVTNDSWGWAWYDNNWKSPKKILSNIISTVARGGTYMLNVGPDRLGNIPEAAQLSLRAAGEWIKRYPQVVYDAKPSPWNHALPWGDIVSQGNKLYLAVYEWPSNGQLYLPGLKNKIVQAKMLTPTKPLVLKTKQADGWICFTVPAVAPDKWVGVVEVTVAGEPEVDTALALDPNIGYPSLTTLLAETEGCKSVKSSWREKHGEWYFAYVIKNMSKDAKATWTVDVKDAGWYNVSVNLRGSGRLSMRVTTDEGEFVQNEQSAASLFCDRPLGWVKINKPGKHTFTLTLPFGSTSTEISSISIVPAGL